MKSAAEFFRSLALPRRFLHSRTSVAQLDRTFGARHWVLARSMCLQRTFNLAGIPANERENAMDIEIRQWSPFKQTGRCIVWEEAAAQVWIWDEDVRRASAKNAGVNSSLSYPETLLCPRMDDTTVRIMSCTEGYEGQIWRNGILLATRWWEGVPSYGEWSRFLMAHDLPPSEIPQVQTAQMLRQPWGFVRNLQSFLSLQYEHRWVLGLTALLVFLLSWQVASAVQSWSSVRDLKEQTSMLSAEIEPLTKARSQALEHKESAEHIARLCPFPTQLQLMAAAVGVFENRQVTLAEWHYSRGSLKFALDGKEPDPTYYISAYEKIPFFKDVTAEPGNRPNRLEVKMTVLEAGRN